MATENLSGFEKLILKKDSAELFCGGEGSRVHTGGKDSSTPIVTYDAACFTSSPQNATA